MEVFHKSFGFKSALNLYCKIIMNRRKETNYSENLIEINNKTEVSQLFCLLSYKVMCHKKKELHKVSKP